MDMTAGTSIARTIVASRRIPAASAVAATLISVPGLARHGRVSAVFMLLTLVVFVGYGR
jgi:hypothetical protein